MMETSETSNGATKVLVTRVNQLIAKHSTILNSTNIVQLHNNPPTGAGTYNNTYITVGKHFETYVNLIVRITCNYLHLVEF